MLRITFDVRWEPSPFFAPLSVTGLGHLLGLETEEVELTFILFEMSLAVPNV